MTFVVLHSVSTFHTKTEVVVFTGHGVEVVVKFVLKVVAVVSVMNAVVVVTVTGSDGGVVTVTGGVVVAARALVSDWTGSETRQSHILPILGQTQIEIWVFRRLTVLNYFLNFPTFYIFF